MRKLTVKNFSVIKEAELEFGKITVLIGPQSSGKSLLCKLAYFMGRVVLEIAIDHVVRLTDFSEFTTAAQREFAKWFPKEGWGERNWSVEFRAGKFAGSISEIATSETTSEAELTFCEEFRTEYQKRLEESLEDQRQRGFVIAAGLRSVAATRFMKLAGRGVWDAATYIPSERSFFVDMQKGYRALAADADRVSAQFAVAFADSMNRDVPKPRLKSFLSGDLVYFPDGPSVSFSDGRLLPINFLSSGSKEMLAILAVLDLYEYRRRSSGPDWLSQELYGDRLYVYDELTIEEPEASVFPQSQYDFVREIAALSNESGFQPHFTITTHSPYILSGFNDLIEAGRLGAETALSKEVNEIIPEKYWVKPGDFKAYSIHDGKLQSIMDTETGLINGEYLDAISNKIGGDFDALLRIGYAKS
jgi:hypothetical protein